MIKNEEFKNLVQDIKEGKVLINESNAELIKQAFYHMEVNSAWYEGRFAGERASIICTQEIVDNVFEQNRKLTQIVSDLLAEKAKLTNFIDLITK